MVLVVKGLILFLKVKNIIIHCMPSVVVVAYIKHISLNCILYSRYWKQNCQKLEAIECITHTGHANPNRNLLIGEDSWWTIPVVIVVLAVLVLLCGQTHSQTFSQSIGACWWHYSCPPSCSVLSSSKPWSETEIKLAQTLLNALLCE